VKVVLISVPDAVAIPRISMSVPADTTKGKSKGNTSKPPARCIIFAIWNNPPLGLIYILISPPFEPEIEAVPLIRYSVLSVGTVHTAINV